MIGALVADRRDTMPLAGALNNLVVGHGLYASAAKVAPSRPDAFEPREHIVHCTDHQVTILDVTVASVTNRAEAWVNRGES